MKQTSCRGSKGKRDTGSLLLSAVVMLLVVTALLLTGISMTEREIQYTRQQLEEVQQ